MSGRGIEVIAGTYEEFVIGYLVQITDNKYSFVQSFADHGHKASVRCVTSNEKFLASGGADDTIHLYDLKTRKESGILLHHNGTVSCLEFTPDGSYLISGGEDGILALCKTGSWQLEKLWTSAHKGSGVIGISVHPSGKMALSIGADATLRTWNLVKGRQAYATRLGSAKCGGGWQITRVLWTPDGNFYAVAIAFNVNVYSVTEAKVVYTIGGEKKVTDICFINDDKLCISDEGGKICIHDIKKHSCLKKIEAYTERIKCLQHVCFNGESFILSASSSGIIKLWKHQNSTLREMCKVNAGCRVTCLTATTCGFMPKLKEEDDEKILNGTEKVKESTGVQNHFGEGEVIIEEEGVEQSEECSDNNEIHKELSTTKKKRKRKSKGKDKKESEFAIKTLTPKREKSFEESEECSDDNEMLQELSTTKRKKKRKSKGTDKKESEFDIKTLTPKREKSPNSSTKTSGKGKVRKSANGWIVKECNGEKT